MEVKEFVGKKIKIRNNDGYLCVSDMFKINKKKSWLQYLESKKTKDFLAELEKETETDLFDYDMSGNKKLIWVHPKVAIHMAMWLSPQFSVKVIDWVMRFINGDVGLMNNMQIENIDREAYEKEIDELKLIINKKDEELLDIKTKSCRYCNKLYKTPAGLIRHENMCALNPPQFIAVIDYTKFKEFIKNLDWKKIREEYAFRLFNLCFTNDVIEVKYKNYKKTFNISLNGDRWEFIKTMSEWFYIRISDLLDESSLNILKNNIEYYNIFKEETDNPAADYI